MSDAIRKTSWQHDSYGFFFCSSTDIHSPNITGCPESRVLPTFPGLSYAVVSWTEPEVNDTSGYVSLNFLGPGTNIGSYGIGVYNVTYIAIDESGNSAICSFMVTIIGELVRLHILIEIIARYM